MTSFWDGKRYHSLDYELKKSFGEKIYKLSLNGGMTCPNRDGTIGYGGCIFCSAGGSGDFASDKNLSITQQIEAEKERMKEKRTARKYIAYFQAFTNTYAPVSYLRKVFTEAIRHPDIVILSIATRPDCLSEEILALLTELNKEKPVWVELGLQTIHDSTAEFIRRGYPLSCFESALAQLNARQLPVITHVILGLPHESEKMMLDTVSYLAHRKIQGIKLQLLHILKHTDLAGYYENSDFSALSLEKYVQLVLSSLELLPPEIVIHRITGDGPKNLLIAPSWSTSKRFVLNTIHKEMALRDSWQGKNYSER